ncbi:RNA polymerase sigma factor [Subtercola sp. RTI3]|uniref:RNA polymerase sigma factor n=1 Tax=Subtercola sp. RTI3 TaxID=3048639 RepID=UPI002B237CB0|nr:RNA polymerase sigma factor [Subtercola sp. RTI3]MEA9986810.1 RNA polymerase sigma factor [Subtercola sp. RTI3]
MPTIPDHLLVDAALLGDTEAFSGLYDRYVATVFDYAYQVTGDDDEALSITQDVFTAAWTNLAKISLGTGSILPWLLTAAQFRCQHAARRAGRRIPTVDITEYERDGSEVDDLDMKVHAQFLLHRIEKEVDLMPTLDATVYRALIHDGLSYDETATLAGISVASVTKRMKRVRARLRKAFREETW